MSEQQLQPKISLAPTYQVIFGLSWDAERKNENIDLDLSGVFFSGYGGKMDACYFNKQVTDDESMRLTGDSRDGKEGGYDEQLIINLNAVNEQVAAIIVSISCHSQHILSNIYSGMLDIKDANGVLIHQTSLADLIRFSPGPDDFNSIIGHCVFRDPENPGKWALQPLLKPTYGKTFEDFMEPMRQSLLFLIHPGLMEEFRFQINNEKPFNVTKGQTVNISGLNKIRIGLGWDPLEENSFSADSSDEIDLDASCIMMEGPNVVDTIYYGKKTSNDGSVKHGGDNLTGEGEGDDERIYVELNKVAPNITCLIFTVTIYTDNYTFKDVENEFVRIFDRSSRKEICKYKLDNMSAFDRKNAMIFCKLYRFGNEWRFLAIGEPETGTTAMALKPLMPKYADPMYEPVVHKQNRKKSSKNHKKSKKSKKTKSRR